MRYWLLLFWLPLLALAASFAALVYSVATLREFYPSANSDSLTLTARHAAPFPLALGPDVP